MVIDKNILFAHYNPVYEQFKYFEKSDLSNMIPSARTLTLSSIDPYHACHFPSFLFFHPLDISSYVNGSTYTWKVSKEPSKFFGKNCLSNTLSYTQHWWEAKLTLDRIIPWFISDLWVRINLDSHLHTCVYESRQFWITLEKLKIQGNSRFEQGLVDMPRLSSSCVTQLFLYRNKGRTRISTGIAG